MTNRFLAATVLILTLGTTSMARENTSSQANINKGNLGMSGTVLYDYNRVSGNTFGLSVTPLYFAVDRFAIGGTLGFESLSGGSRSSTVTITQVGPTVLWYFWAGEKSGIFLEEEVLFTILNSSGSSTSNSTTSSITQLGYNYFLVPEVAFGPAFRYQHDFESNFVDDFQLVGAFSIYF